MLILVDKMSDSLENIVKRIKAGEDISSIASNSESRKRNVNTQSSYKKEVHPNSFEYLANMAENTKYRDLEDKEKPETKISISGLIVVCGLMLCILYTLAGAFHIKVF